MPTPSTTISPETPAPAALHGPRRHPFEALPEGSLRVGLVPLGAFLVLAWTVFPLVFPYPDFHAITQLVLSGSVPEARAVVAEWSVEARLRVTFWGGFDFVVDLAAWNAAALACVWAGRTLARPMAVTAGTLLAWGCWLGFLFNVPENLAFVRMTLGPVSAPWPQVAAVSAVLRLVLLGATLVFLGVALLARLRRRRVR